VQELHKLVHYNPTGEKDKHASFKSQVEQGRLDNFVKRFHQEVALILDLKDGVAYASFLNGLRSGQFKFSLAKEK